MMKKVLMLVLMLALAASTLACKSSGRSIEDKLLREISGLDKEEIYAKGEEQFELGRYKKSRDYYTFLYDTFPNDPLGHKAALRIADGYATWGDSINLTEARLRYRDFVNRYPNDPDRPYALMKLGETYYRRRGKADRDLEFCREGIASFEQMLALYPDTDAADEARRMLAELYDMLAEHEYMVAFYYSRAGRLGSSMRRLDYLLENHPQWSRLSEAEALLVDVKHRLDVQYEKLNVKRRKKGLEPLKPEYLREQEAEDGAEDGEVESSDSPAENEETEA